MHSAYARCIDVCPDGQKLADGTVNPDWADTRDKLWVTGTGLAKMIKHFSTTHPWRNTRGLVRDLLKSIIFGYKEPFSAMTENILRMGNAGESVALKMLQAELDAEGNGHTLIFPGLLVSTEDHRWGGSPDAIIVDRDGNFVALVEVKTLVLRENKFDDQGVAVFPAEYYAQAHLYMWLTGIRVGIGLQYEPTDRKNPADGGKIFRTPIPFDDANWAAAYSAAVEFTKLVEHLMDMAHIAMGPEKIKIAEEPYDFVGALLMDSKRRQAEATAEIAMYEQLLGAVSVYMAKPIKRPGANKRSLRDISGGLDDEDRELLARYL